uniref:Uncharacterized protein n=1 Tax=Periophthalmus magnuspinnatus TaxID=409849 RepID=A0A3B4AMU1_9GOBI
MERLKLVLQYFQSNSESISNGICILLALVSVRLYTSFDFNCPCLPQYNRLYSLGVMVVPPIILFFLGLLVNRHTGVMMDEWLRPEGNRSKNPANVLCRFLFSAMLQRALLAPMVWILVSLLDGKILICAFSVNVDPSLFSGTNPPHLCPLFKSRLKTHLFRLSCLFNQSHVFYQSLFCRKAVTRYVRCYSQAVGWSILLFLIVLGSLARFIKPFFDDHARFLQTRYWSNYLDVEQKMFDETCVLHARDFARKCVVQFFEEMRDDSVPELDRPYFTVSARDEWESEDEDRLHGITRQELMNQLLDKWFYSKPLRAVAPPRLEEAWASVRDASWTPP